MSEPVRIDRASLDLPASPEALYAAFADPAKLVAWLPPDGMTGQVIAYDFREGGSYRIALSYAEELIGVVGKSSERTDVSSGRFLALEPGRRVVQTVEFDSTDAAFAGEMRMTWTLEPTATGTTVTVMAEDVPPGIGQADHEEGLRASLSNLAAYMLREP